MPTNDFKIFVICVCMIIANIFILLIKDVHFNNQTKSDMYFNSEAFLAERFFFKNVYPFITKSIKMEI